MTGADGSPGRDAVPGWRWDVALSFAGSQRDYVEQVAQALKARGVRCFYDADEQIDMWGKYLAEELPVIYSEQSAAVVVFLSAEYAARDWTRHERRAALARAVRERREYVLPVRFDDTPLPGLLSDMVTVDLRDRSPQEFAAMIAAKLATLGIAASAPSDSAGSLPQNVEMALPAGVMRAGEADLRRLGVHATISVPGLPDEVPPEYVPRDVDNAEHGLWGKVEAAKKRGGFVLLVGGSSVGKTRSAVEAVRALLPDWWLVHPAGSAEVAALARASVPRTVVWLDELQRYLDGEQGLTGGIVRALLNAPHPAVVIGTLWPDLWTTWSAVPAPGDDDPHAREREVLDLAAVVRIGQAFSPSEQGRAHAAATRDRRLKIALQAAGFGLTQTLAAAPQLVARWQDAQAASPYAWAVLTAALDAARLGVRAPLSGDLLRAAAPGYCTSQQQADAPDNWFERALAYATGKLHGAAATLSPAAVGMGKVAGYTVAEYLIQHASRERRSARVPASTWEAVISHIRNPADAARLADSASNRLLYCYAIPFYGRAADGGDADAAERLSDLLAERGDVDGLHARTDAGDGYAAWRLARLLEERGDLDGLRARADAGDADAAERLARLLAGRGDLEGLRARADAGDADAVWQLARLLAGRGDLDGLRAQADAGDDSAARRLADLLEERGDLDGAEQILRVRADAGDGYAAGRLARLLEERGELGGAEQILRGRAGAGDGVAAEGLADLLAGRGDLDGAEQVLRARAGAGDGVAAGRLADLLAGRGDLDGLRARAGAGDGVAAGRLADLLEERGDLDGAEQVLRARAGAGDAVAAGRLADLLEERGDLDGAEQVLRARAGAGDGVAAGRLADLLEERGDLERAEQVLRARAGAGDAVAAGRLADLLEERGDLDGAEQVLRARAGAGDGVAAGRLADLLEERGDLDGLRARADTGDGVAAGRLADLLAGRGDLDGLRARADTGDGVAAGRLADLLEERGDLDGLRARADTGDGVAAGRLADLLAGRGDLDGLRARADTGDGIAAGRLADLLEERSDLDGAEQILRAATDAGEWWAGRQLAEMLIKQGRNEEAERLRRFGLNSDGSIASA